MSLRFLAGALRHSAVSVVHMPGRIGRQVARAMRTAGLLSLLALAGCGGSGAPEQPAPPSSPPLIRFEAAYNVATPASAGGSIEIRPIAGSTGIGSNPIARVELSTNGETPVILTAPNSADTAGRPAYRFTVPFIPSETSRIGCITQIPFRVTVTDETGFSFTKRDTFCPAQSQTADAFSDYGNKTVTFVASATAPAHVSVARFGAGVNRDYRDRSASDGVTAYALGVRAVEGDRATISAGYPAGSVPDGTTVTARVEGEGGSFAESVVATNPHNWFTADATLVCCQLSTALDPSRGTKQVSLVVDATRFGPVPLQDLVPLPGSNPVILVPFVEYDYSYRIFDPATGNVVAESSGSATQFNRWTFDLNVGHQITLEARPKSTEATVRVLVSTPGDNTLGEARSNRTGVPARLTVFCCSR
jgi:hypothetical protein